MSLDSRIATASGAAASAGAALLLAQRLSGTIPAVLLLSAAAAAAGPAASSTEEGAGALRRQVRFSLAWALAAMAASVRAGTTVVADVAGAHAVAGLSILRGPFATVAGMWLCMIGVSIAVGGAAPERSLRGGDPEPWYARRLAVAAGLAQVGLAVALFAGPQVRRASDAVPWIVASVLFGAWSWFGRGAARLPAAPAAAAALAALGLVLTLIGGRP